MAKFKQSPVKNKSLNADVAAAKRKYSRQQVMARQPPARFGSKPVPTRFLKLRNLRKVKPGYKKLSAELAKLEMKHKNRIKHVKVNSSFFDDSKGIFKRKYKPKKFRDSDIIAHNVVPLFRDSDTIVHDIVRKK